VEVLWVCREGLHDESLEVEHDVDYVFDDTRYGGEFVSDAIDSDCGDRGAFDVRKQNASQCVTESGSVSSVQGLDDELSVYGSISVSFVL
jgi:hypothetical protein